MVQCRRTSNGCERTLLRPLWWWWRLLPLLWNLLLQMLILMLLLLLVVPLLLVVLLSSSRLWAMLRVPRRNQRRGRSKQGDPARSIAAQPKGIKVVCHRAAFAG